MDEKTVYKAYLLAIMGKAVEYVEMDCYELCAYMLGVEDKEEERTESASTIIHRVKTRCPK